MSLGISHSRPGRGGGAPGPVQLIRPFALPPGVFDFNFFRQPSGKVTSNFDRQVFAPAPVPGEDGVVTIHVDGSLPNSGGTGLSWATAVRSIETGVIRGNQHASPRFVLLVRTVDANGNKIVYPRVYCPSGAAGGTVPTKPCAYYAFEGRVETGYWDDLVWTLVSGTMYRATRSVGRRAVDLANPGPGGIYPDLVWASTQALCQATPGTWFTDNTGVFINRFDGAPVTNLNTRVFLNVVNSPVRMSSGGNMYVFGFDVMGGTPALLTGAPQHRFVAEESTFRYSSGEDGIIISAKNPRDGVAIFDLQAAAFIRCDASANQKDGFNAHIGSTAQPFMYTEDCSGFLNGRPGATSCNGLTSHDGLKAIDLRGSYFNNAGGQVAIVNDGTEMWCIDTEASFSRGDQIYGGGVAPSDFLVDQGSPVLTLENCRSKGSRYSLNTRFGTINVRGGNHTGGRFIANGGVINEAA